MLQNFSEKHHHTRALYSLLRCVTGTASQHAIISSVVTWSLVSDLTLKLFIDVLIQNMMIHLVFFCSPFIQLLGDLDEIKKNADIYINSKRDSWDLTKQNAKLGMVP
jgi:hypothetical protein